MKKKKTYTEQLKDLTAKIPKLNYVRELNDIQSKPFNRKEFLKAAKAARETFTDEELLYGIQRF